MYALVLTLIMGNGVNVNTTGEEGVVNRFFLML